MTPEQEEMLRDVHTCLVGNKIKGQRGLIDRIDVCENVQESHAEKFKSIESTLEKKANKITWSSIFKFIKIFKAGV